jgi:hypothetical protein
VVFSWVETLRSRSLVLRSELLYSAAVTVLMTLARAAPMRVPATPKKEATTADETAARALAAICTGLSWLFLASAASGRSTVSVRGADMSSEGSASGGRAAGR